MCCCQTLRAMAVGVLLAAGAAALAQTPPTAAASARAGGALRSTEAVVDPAAAVPGVLYRSVFVDTPMGVETEEADWKKANAEVGQFRRGHVDILQWEAGQKGRKP